MRADTEPASPRQVSPETVEAAVDAVPDPVVDTNSEGARMEVDAVPAPVGDAAPEPTTQAVEADTVPAVEVGLGSAADGPQDPASDLLLVESPCEESTSPDWDGDDPEESGREGINPDIGSTPQAEAQEAWPGAGPLIRPPGMEPMCPPTLSSLPPDRGEDRRPGQGAAPVTEYVWECRLLHRGLKRKRRGSVGLQRRQENRPVPGKRRG